MAYKYITENNLENIQTYMYSEYGGAEFLKQYFESRENSEKDDEQVKKEDINQYFSTRLSSDTSKQLYGLWKNIVHDQIDDETKRLIDKYVKRFEVKKRLYGKYSDKGIAVLNSGYNDYVSYLLLALITIEIYQAIQNLKYLNCLLKITDTLISIKSELNFYQMRILNLIIVKEKRFIRELMLLNNISKESLK